MTIDVTILGLGAMGGAIAREFVAAGHTVTVWNRTQAKTDRLQALGARGAESIQEAVTASPVVVMCLLNYEVSKRLLEDPAVLSQLTGRTIVNTASASPEEVVDFERFVADAGADYLDAKLMMYPHAVGAEDSVIYVSGDESVYTTHQETLAVLGGQPTYLGLAVAAAATTYQASWTVYFSALFGYLESAALMRRAGLRVEEFLPKALRALKDVSWHLEDVTRRLAEVDFSGDEAELSTYVDGFIAMRDTFQQAGIDSLMLRSMQELLTAGEHAGYAHRDVAVIAEMLSSVDRAD